jgi:hypothetical protein
MTQSLTEMVYKINIINEDIHRLLLKVIDQKDFEPIYEKTFGDDEEVEVLKYFKSQGYENLKEFILNSFEITGTGSEAVSIEVKKEIFIMENGVILVFHHIAKCFKDSNTQIWIAISERMLSKAQTLTETEKECLEGEVTTKLRNFL